MCILVLIYFKGEKYFFFPFGKFRSSFNSKEIEVANLFVLKEYNFIFRSESSSTSRKIERLESRYRFVRDLLETDKSTETCL